MSSVNLDKVKVLIIEDDMDLCFLLTVILKSKNIPSSFVNTISEAKKECHRLNPPVIFLDNHLPDGLGVNFIAYAKANYPETKIVMITGRSNEMNRKQALANGAEFFVAKPFNADELLGIIDKIII